MLTLMDWRLQIEHRRLCLTRTGQERLEQLAYAKQAGSRPKKRVAVHPKTQAVTAPCCQATKA